MYTLSLNAPTTSFTLLKSGMAGMQVSFDSSYSFVYLHSTITGQWYKHELATNKITDLNFTTAVTPGNALGAGLRDLAGPHVAALPAITLP
jgi:hypothetical protein